MPLTTNDIELTAEQERIRDVMDEVAEEQANWEGDETHAQQLLTRGNELNNRVNILGHVRDEWGVDSVTLAGLTAGEVNLVEDVVDDNRGVRHRDVWVALGTHDAPYVEHDPESVTKSDLEDTVANVTDLPLPYVQWAEGKISELSHIDEGTGNGYLELVQEKRGE